MYYYISGKYAEEGDGFVVVDAGGVGYKINTSALAKTMMPDIGEHVKLYTYFHVREDIQELYGFPANEELSMFLLLLSVSGVGPKAALSILSSATPKEIAAAVIKKDEKVITKAQGVGSKLAQRVLLELKNKMKNIDISDVPENTGKIQDNSDEIMSALAVLGYSQQEAKAALADIDVNMSVEDTIREALKKLMK